MKLYDCDWNALLRVVGRWNGLGEEERWCFMEIMQQAPSSFSQWGVESEADILVGAGLLQHLEKKPEMLRLTPDGDNLRRLLNDLDKLMTPLDGAKGIEPMTDYVRSLLSMSERRELMGSAGSSGMESREISEWLAKRSASPSWVIKFISAERPEDWTGGAFFSTQDQLFSHGDVFGTVKRIIDEIDSAGGVLPLHELTAFLGRIESEVLATSLKKAISSLLLFLSLSESNKVRIGILPGTWKELHREPVQPPEGFAMEGMSIRTPMFDDMSVLMVEASTSPIRTRKNDGAIFAKRMDILAEALQPIDEQLSEFMHADRQKRVNFCRHVLLKTGYLEEADSKDDRHILRPTTRGREWIALGRRERLRAVLKWIADFMNFRRIPPTGYADQRITLGLFPDYSPRLFTRYYRGLDVRKEILCAFTVLDGLDCVWVDELFEFFYSAGNILETYMDQNNEVLYIEDGYHLDTATDEMVADEWVHSLNRVLMNVLIMLGCVAFGFDEAGRMAVKLTDAGGFLLGLRDDFDLNVEEETSIVVQPDFTVVFLSPCPGAESVIAPLAERIGRGVGELFRINGEKVMKVASSGISAESMISDLESLSGSELPKNVNRQIRDWCGQCRRVRKKSVILIRCPDRETALRVKSAGKSKVEQLNDTVLAISDRKAMRQLARDLQEKGITFE